MVDYSIVMLFPSIVKLNLSNENAINRNGIRHIPFYCNIYSLKIFLSTQINLIKKGKYRIQNSILIHQLHEKQKRLKENYGVDMNIKLKRTLNLSKILITWKRKEIKKKNNNFFINNR